MKGMKLLFVVLLSTLITCINAQTISPDYYDGEIYIKLKEGEKIYGQPGQHSYVSVRDIPFLQSFVKKYGIEKARLPFHWSTSEVLKQVYQVSFTNISLVEELLNEIQRLPVVEYAERIPIYRTCYTPDDSKYSTQWHLSKISQAKAWDISKGSQYIVIGDVDNEFDENHEDLKNSLWSNPGEIAGNGIDDDKNGFIDDVHGWDLADDDNKLSASWSHGTHTAGTCAATTNNKIGVASSAHTAQVMLVKVAQSSSDVKYAAEGVVYAADNGAHVINMSWGGVGMSGVYKSAMDHAYGKGIVLVAAAGNSGASNTFYPAGFTNVIGVANLTSSDAKHSSSQYGTWVDVSAPGSNILSTVAGNKYAGYTGTSMASPVVSSVCALMRSYNMTVTPAQITQCLLDNCDKIDNANPNYVGQLGKGRINAEKAMNCMKTKYASTVSVAEMKDAVEIELFPNPSSDFISFMNESGEEVVITDVMGKVLMNHAGERGMNKLNVGSLASGVYYLTAGKKTELFIKE